MTNDLVVIRKNKVALTLNKPAYIGMCTFELSEILMYKCTDFQFTITLKINVTTTQVLFADTDSLMYEMYEKIEDVYEDFSSD